MVNEIYGLLLAQVEEARRAHKAAREKFWNLADKPRERPGFPTGLSEPDGADLIRNAVYEENDAREAHLEAMKRLNRYLLDGTIPEDVREKLGKTQSAG